MTEPAPSTLPAVQKPKHTGVALPLGVNDLQPKNFAELKQLCNELANSDIVPKDFQKKPANILVAVSFGREIGLPWSQALQNIAVINGRPCLWGDAVGAKVMASNLLETQSDSFYPEKDGGTATFTVKRVGQPAITRSFSHEDAKRAELLSKDTYKKYERRMLFNRARAWAYRDAFPDVLKGLRIAEEEMDVVIETTATSAAPAEMPRRASEPAPATPAAAESSSETSAAGEAQPAETKKVSLRFEKVQKIKDEARWRAIGKDGIDYMLTIEAYATTINAAIKADVAVEVDYEDGMGCREVFNVSANLPAQSK